MEGSFERFGFEGARRTEFFAYCRQNSPGAAGEFIGLRRRPHAAGGADEKFVVEEIAKTIERMAESRLTESKRIPGCSQRSQTVYRFQRIEKAQIDLTGVHYLVL
jgi:hypothetical protein